MPTDVIGTGVQGRTGLPQPTAGERHRPLHELAVAVQPPVRNSAHGDHGDRRALATHDAKWVHDYSGDPKVMTRYFVDRNVQPEQPPPNRYPVPVGERIGLPEPLMLDAPVVDVIRHRRTARDFLGTSISLSEVATLLGAAFAPRFPAESPTLYTTQTYSRGAPFVVFALFAGGGVPQALRRDHAAYQYNPEGNQLVFRGSASIGAWSELLWRQDYANGAPMLLVICADWQQYMWKYRTARAYRWALMECGAFMHTTLLAATALGLRTFQTPAVDDAEVGPLYVAAFGRSTPASDHQ